VEPGKNIYFLSDAHLGSPDYKSSLQREKRLVSFLKQIQSSASDIFFLGDLFDFWFEYRRVVPRGFTRLLGTLSELSDAGIRLHFFTGNHDIWLFDYLENEIGMTVYRRPARLTLGQKEFFLAHGDGFDETDHRFKIIKKIFTCRILQWGFSRLHPNFAIWLAHSWSNRSREKHGEDPFREEEEPMVKYARKHLLNRGYDYLIFGHRHCPVNYPLDDHTRLIILGDWLTHFSYAMFDGDTVTLGNKLQ